MNNAQYNVCNIVSAIVGAAPINFLYTDLDGVLSLRTATPKSIEKCACGTTVVRAFDHNRNAPRTFILSAISEVTRA